MMRVVDFPLFLVTMSSVLIAVKGNYWLDDCVNPLGMESGKIPASRITASSSFDEKSVGPQNSRIRQENSGGAWCPKIQIRDGVKEYLEIDFGEEFRLTQTETQGRFGNGRGLEFAEQFKIEYYRDFLNKWIPYKDHFGRTIFDANKNTYLGVIQQLNPPIIATRLRFIPYSLHPRTICMRVEAYGCHFTDGVVYYECPNGYWKKNPSVDFRDTSYDGWMDESGVLQGGLGLLVDSLMGPNDFRVTHTNKGNSWMGWDNHNNQSDPIKIGFQFDRLRKFKEVSIHVNNFVSQGAQVFASVDIYFSMDGQKFSDVPLRWVPKGDLKNETAHLVQIPLKGRLATYIRLEFFHSNHWLLLSEILFRSDIFTGNVTDEILSLNYLQDGPQRVEIDKNGSKDVAGTSSPTTSSGAMIGLIAGSLSVLVVLLVVTLVCYVMRRNRRNTKLVGVMGMTPKSMSMGLGGCSDNSTHKNSSTCTITNSGTSRRMGKIALCDLKPVSISGETDSDESLYHELVFGLGGVGSVSKSDGSSAPTLPSATGIFSHHQNSRKNTNRKIKYQRVNHDFMGLRSIHDELGFFNPSSPSTPSSMQKQNLSHHLSHSHQTILPPPPTFRHHHLDHGGQQLHHPLLNLQSSSKTLSSLGNGNCNGGNVFTTCASKSSSAIPPAASTLGFFNSPHGRRPTNNNSTSSQSSNPKTSSQSNYYAATDIFQVSDKHFDRF